MDRLRVLELGRRLGVASAGLTLTSLGADLVQVVLPGRSVEPAERSYYDRGRTVITPDPRLAELARMCDVVLTDLDEDELSKLGVPGNADELRGGATPQVLVSIRSLGRSGPHRGFRMTDLTEWASSGLATVTRRPHAHDPERYVPVLPPGCQPQALAGLAASTAALAAHRWARASGRGVVADVSVQEVVASLLHGILPVYVWNGVVTGHPDTPSTALGMLLPAADGDVYVRTLDPRQWEALVEWVGDPTIDALGRDPDSRLANNDALILLLSTWTSSQPRDGLLEEGQRRRIPIALPRSLDDVLAWQHLRARGVWRDVDYEGRAALAPRLPLLEPAAWAPTTTADAAEVARAWSAS